jgi:hypothetical protein
MSISKKECYLTCNRIGLEFWKFINWINAAYCFSKKSNFTIAYYAMQQMLKQQNFIAMPCKEARQKV